jgi:hypothetical protein
MRLLAASNSFKYASLEMSSLPTLATIQSNNAFKEEGKFSVGKYKALLKMNGLVDLKCP